MPIPNNFLEEGKKKEMEFALLYCKASGINPKYIYEASKEDDMYRHIDIWIGHTAIDVKAAKKTNRADETPNYDIHWIELRNVNGEKAGYLEKLIVLHLNWKIFGLMSQEGL